MLAFDEAVRVCRMIGGWLQRTIVKGVGCWLWMYATATVAQSSSTALSFSLQELGLDALLKVDCTTTYGYTFVWQSDFGSIQLTHIIFLTLTQAH